MLVCKELKQFIFLFFCGDEANQRLNKIMMTNKITPKIAAQLIYELTDGKNKHEVEDIIKNIAAFLLKNNLVKKEAEIVKRYSDLYDLKNNIVKAEFLVADEIDAQTKKMIIEYVSVLTGDKKVNEEINIDKTKLGGFSVKIGDKIYDYTIRKNINDLKNTLNK